MMMGEIGSESRYGGVVVAQILYVVYAFIVVILLSNVLIAIVTDSYEIIQNDRAAIVFGSNRLDFVAEMDAMAAVGRRAGDVLGFGRGQSNDGPRGSHCAIQESAGDGKDDTTAEASSSTASKYSLREIWHNVTVVLFERDIYRNHDHFETNSLEIFCHHVSQAIAILFIIPLWLVLGLATAGILWPPQVREYLFLQKVRVTSRAELERQKVQKLGEIKNNVDQLKEDIRRELEADRQDLVRLKNEVESIQKEVVTDLQEMQGLLSAILDFGA